MTDTTPMPLISVIVPTFERSDMLPRALDSIYAQTWPNIQVVVVDDDLPGSQWQARTQAALEPYLRRPNFIYTTTTGAVGGGAARNQALRLCTGEYIAYLDDDDLFYPEKLEKQVRFMLDHGLDASYHDVEWLDANGKLVERRVLDYATGFSTEELLKTHILRSLCPTAVYMIRRDRLLETEGFGETPSGQDFILMLRCIESGMSIGYLPGVYVTQFLHNGRRISLGSNKVRGENMLYELKHRYFHLLTRKERRYVKFRHYAVLSFASLRSHRPIRAALHGAHTVLISPGSCLKEGIRYFRSKTGGKG